MLLAVAAFAAATAHAAEIRVATQGAHSVAVVGVRPAERATPLRVYTGDPPAADQPEIAGRVEATADGLVFHPLFPFVAGLRYTAVFGATSRVFEVAAPGGAAPRVTALFPSGDTLPENTLRLYVHFSQPMEERDVQRHVHLLDEGGREVELPFVEIEHGLWDPDRTRLTLLFHPGRVKRGVAPGEALGPPLVAGQGYRLVVDADVRDAAGRRLGQAFEHAFHATRADRTSPEARSFVVHPPAEPRAALEVELPEALDEALLRRWIWVEDASGTQVRGRIAISAGETRWSFTPDAPWSSKPHVLRVNPALEDRAGNRFDRLFDREIVATATTVPATSGLPLSLSFALGTAAPSTAPQRAIVAYVFPQERTIDPAEIAAERLTHVNYAFANIREGRVVEGFVKDAENLKALTSLRARNPALAILVSVGGWTWSGGFSDAVLTPQSRAAFVASAVDYVRRHDLDGFDVDWEYPGLVGFGNVHRPEDRENFTALMAELRTALDALGRETKRRYLLTMAAGASDEFLEHTEMAKVQACLDLVNLMTYDFREAGSDPLAGHHANLFANPRDPERRSADGAVRAFIAAGVPASKLVLGVPFYGKAWGDVTPENDGLYEPGGPLATRLPTHYGDLAASVDAGGFVRRWDDAAQAAYLWNAAKRIFVTYEDPESLAIKGRYIRDQGLAGAMFWEYYADPGGTLLATLDRELHPRRD